MAFLLGKLPEVVDLGVECGRFTGTDWAGIEEEAGTATVEHLLDRMEVFARIDGIEGLELLALRQEADVDLLPALLAHTTADWDGLHAAFDDDFVAGTLERAVLRHEIVRSVGVIAGIEAFEDADDGRALAWEEREFIGVVDDGAVDAQLDVDAIRIWQDMQVTCAHIDTEIQEVIDLAAERCGTVGSILFLLDALDTRARAAPTGIGVIGAECLLDVLPAGHLDVEVTLQGPLELVIVLEDTDVVCDDVKAVLIESHGDDVVLESDIAWDKRDEVFGELEPDEALLEPHLRAPCIPEGADVAKEHLLFDGRRLVDGLFFLCGRLDFRHRYRMIDGSLYGFWCRWISGVAWLIVFSIGLEGIWDILDERGKDQGRDFLDMHELVEHPRDEVLLREVRVLVGHKVQDAVLFTLDGKDVAV